MDDREAGRYWDENAGAWTLASRQGWDVYRDFLNTPAFLAIAARYRSFHVATAFMPDGYAGARD